MNRSLSPTEGPLGRVATTVYWFVVIDLLLVLTALPGLVVLMLLARDASNIPLVALALVPLGPAVAAGLFAWRDYDREQDQSPASHFWRGYRLNVVDVLKMWVPTLALLAVLAINGANVGVVSLPGGFGIVLTVVAVVVVLWWVHALVITALFSFRARDTARLAVYFLGARPLVTLGYVSLLVLTGGIVLLTSDWVLGFLASLLTFFLLRNARPVVATIEARFLEPDGS